MSKVLQLSDLHVRRRTNARENKRLRKIVGWIRRRYANARPHVILSGDITHNGTEAEYENAVEILSPLRADGFSIVSCPGNHDVGPLGNSFSTAARVYFQQYILGELMGIAEARTASDILDQYYPMVTPLPDAVMVGLDSAHREDYLASGRLGTAQIAKLKTALAEIPDTKRVLVYVHHHPFIRGRMMRIIDGDALLNAIGGKADLLCFGHRHTWEFWRDHHGVSVICASGKTTKPIRGKGLRFYEFEIGEAVPRVHKRIVPPR